MSRLADALVNIRLAWRLALFDGQAVGAVADDDRSVWRSFWVMPAALLLNGVAAAATAPAFGEVAEPRSIAGPGWLVVTWLLSLNIAAEFARKMGRLDDFPRYVVAHNWAALIQAMVLAGSATLFAAAGDAAGKTSLFVIAVVGFWSLIYDWFVTKQALAVDGPPAALLIATQLLAAWFVMQVAARLVA